MKHIIKTAMRLGIVTMGLYAMFIGNLDLAAALFAFVAAMNTLRI